MDWLVVLVDRVSWSVYQIISQVGGNAIALAVAWALAGALASMVERLILRHRARHAGTRMLSTIVGLTLSWVIGWAVGWIVGWTIGSTASGVMGEVPAGIEEWHILRGEIYSDSRWMLASVVGWSVGLALPGIRKRLTRQAICDTGSWIAVMIAVGVWGIALSLGLDLGSFVGFLVDSTSLVALMGLLIGWSAVGVLAGGLLLWILRSPTVET
jgi:hypothetical protein